MGELALAVSVSDAPFWVWWLVPVVVTVLAVLVARLVARRGRPRDGFDTVDDYARFRAAMSDVRGSRREEQ